MLLFQGLWIVLQHTWQKVRAPHFMARNDAAFFAGLCCLGLPAIAAFLALIPHEWPIAHTTPAFAFAFATLLWVMAALLYRALPNPQSALATSQRHPVLLWMFVPIAPLVYGLLLFVGTHRPDTLFWAAFLPAGTLVAAILAHHLLEGLRSVADGLVQTSLDKMSAHQRLALASKTARSEGPHPPPSA